MGIKVDVGPNRGSQQKKKYQLKKKKKKKIKKVDKRSWGLTGDMNSKSRNMLKVLNHFMLFFSIIFM